jgi:hypothetical protein
MFRGSSGADYANAIAALGVGYEQQRAFDHADARETIFAVIAAIVVFTDAEGIGKNQARTSERDAMLGVVRNGLGVIPLKVIIGH